MHEEGVTDDEARAEGARTEESRRTRSSARCARGQRRTWALKTRAVGAAAGHRITPPPSNVAMVVRERPNVNAVRYSAAEKYAAEAIARVTSEGDYQAVHMKRGFADGEYLVDFVLGRRVRAKQHCAWARLGSCARLRRDAPRHAGAYADAPGGWRSVKHSTMRRWTRTRASRWRKTCCTSKMLHLPVRRASCCA